MSVAVPHPGGPEDGAALARAIGDRWRGSEETAARVVELENEREVWRERAHALAEFVEALGWNRGACPALGWRR